MRYIDSEIKAEKEDRIKLEVRSKLFISWLYQNHIAMIACHGRSARKVGHACQVNSFVDRPVKVEETKGSVM